MKTFATNAPIQLRKEIHIGSFMDIIFLDLIKRYYNPSINLIIEWNALGVFREKDGTLSHNDMMTLHARMSSLVNCYLDLKQTPFHYLDDNQNTLAVVSEIIFELMGKNKIFIKEYESLYCEHCDSYIGSINHSITKCKRCSNSFTIKKTIDLFAKTNKEEIIRNANNSIFYPSYTKEKFFGGISDMPSIYSITKSRKHGLSANEINSLLKGKVIDPKFIFSLFPIIIGRLGFQPLDTVVIGEDILVRYLYYLFANSGLLQPQSLKIFVHGMLTRNRKKISKYGNFPQVADITSFLDKWSWDHIKLLCLSSKFGRNIDFDKKIIEVQKIITKRKNVLHFFQIAFDQKLVSGKNRSSLEEKITKHCDLLISFLGELRLFHFYQGYLDLWFNLLSREYISDLKKGTGSITGLLEINEKINLLP